MRMLMSTVSAAAIALMIGGSAIAGSTSSTMGTNNSSATGSTTSQSSTANQNQGGTANQNKSTNASGSATMASKSADDAMMRDRLSQAGVTDPQQVTGYILTAEGADGQPIIMVVGPENMKGSEVKDFDQAKFDKKLLDAGFKNAQKVGDGHMMRGSMDKNVALLVVGEPGWTDRHGASTSASATTTSGHPDQEKLKEQVGKAGIGGADRFAGQVLRVDNEGEPAFLIIAPNDFKAGQKVAVTSDEQSKLDESGFSTMDQATDIVALQGRIGNNPVIIFTGPGLSE